MIKDKISIIVPVYNVEKYLRECLDALINQTYTNIEILCVDDGSTDSSGKILDEYVDKDGRIKVFHQANKGLGSARNLGLKKATSEYLMFCDPDDTYEPIMCEEMHKAITENDVDFVVCAYRPIFYLGHGRSLNTNYHSTMFCGNMFMTNWLKCRTNGLLWKKIFKMELIKNFDISFPDGIHFVDPSFMWQYLSVSSKVYGLNKKLYNYRYLPESSSSNIFALSEEISKHYYKIIEFAFTSMVKNNLLEQNKNWFLRRINDIEWLFLNLRSINFVPIFLRQLHDKILYYFTIDELKPYNLLYLCKQGKYQEVINKYCKNIQPQSTSKPTKTKKPFFGKTTSADGKETTNYFFRIPLFKKKILEGVENYYIFGKKLYTGLRYNSIKNLQDKLNQIENKLKSIEIKQNTNIKANFYSQSSNDNKLIICFDSLVSPHCECAHAYALFKELQSEGIPSKYIALKLAPSYQTYLEGQKDIIAVSSAAEFINNYAHIINRASKIYAGASLGDTFDRALSSLPYLDYIYLGSGALGLKKWKIREIIPARFNKIYAPTSISLQAIKSLNIWEDDDIIAKPLPLWSELKANNTQDKKIFVFFSWRTSFWADKNMAKKYVQNIVNFVSKLHSQISADTQIALAWHHRLTLQGVELPAKLDGVEIVASHAILDEIKSSSMLITDYSSVAFDFMAQDKPVVFYRFDANDLGLNDQDNIACVEAMEYDDMLGAVCYGEKSAFERILEFAKNSFALSTEQKEQNENLFFGEN